jgi:hypothetical protein
MIVCCFLSASTHQAPSTTEAFTTNTIDHHVDPLHCCFGRTFLSSSNANANSVFKPACACRLMLFDRGARGLVIQIHPASLRLSVGIYCITQSNINCKLTHGRRVHPKPCHSVLLRIVYIIRSISRSSTMVCNILQAPA